MVPADIRSLFKEYFDKLPDDDKCLSGVEGFGHQAGIPVEDWVKERLNEALPDIHTYSTREFFQVVFCEYSGDIEKLLESTWWGFKGYRGARLLITKGQIESIQSGESPDEWQQSGSDLVVYLGEDSKSLYDIVAINVKSHNTSRESRDPNIMSAQRLLYFFKDLLDRDFDLDRVAMWFLGVEYHVDETETLVENIHIRDLFSLDLDSLPLINFDAAIQIQWHVHNMVEKTQSKREFMGNLAGVFMEQWSKHSSGKTKRYEKIVSEILEATQSDSGDSGSTSWFN